MKVKSFLPVFIAALICVLTVSCGTKKDSRDIWSSGTYTENTEFGQGEKTINVEVLAEEKTVEFTLYTDKATLGEALLEHNLISGEQGAYGLYVKSVNGIYADYNTTNSYWSVNKNGEYMMTGVDSTEIADGESYQFVYTKN